MMNYENDPLMKFCHDIRKMAEELNRNLEGFKAATSIQANQNQYFIETLVDLLRRVRVLEEQGNKNERN